jgi:hypothetical protein
MSDTSWRVAGAKWVGAITAFLVLIWTAYEFLHEKRLEREEVFNVYQLELYQETARLAALMATSKNDAVRNSAHEQFLALNWGQNLLVESTEVERWMSYFKTAYANGSEHGGINSFSMCLARAMRIDLQQTWRIEQWRLDDQDDQNARECARIKAALSEK